MAICKDWTNPNTGQLYKGCGEAITWIKTAEGKNVAYSQTWEGLVEHKTICPARKDQQQKQTQPMPNVQASQPREAVMIQSETLNEIHHSVEQLRKEVAPLVFLIQEIAKKLAVGGGSADDV